MARYSNDTVIILDTNGKPIVGAYTYFYEPGTTTLKSVFSDEDLLISQANPVRTLAGGILPEIFIDGLYAVVQKDEDDIAIYPTQDPVGEIIAGQFEAYNSADTYAINEIVLATDGNYYISLVSSNQGNEPSISASQWQIIPVKDMVGLTETQTLTNKTLTTPIIAAIKGVLGLVVAKFVDVASAVNEITFTNSATGNAPSIEPTGTDANIDIDVTPKGTGDINLTPTTGRTNTTNLSVIGITRGSVTAGITADVGSIQGGSPLTSEVNEISVCANAGDSVTLPVAVGGQIVTVINNGANAADVFPASGDDLGAGVDTAASLPIATSITYVDYDGTNWEILSEELTTGTVLSKIAGASVGDIGSYAFLYNTAASAGAAGSTLAGSVLRYSNTVLTVGGTPAGTWRSMGVGTTLQATLWLRIS